MINSELDNTFILFQCPENKEVISSMDCFDQFRRHHRHFGISEKLYIWQYACMIWTNLPQQKESYHRAAVTVGTNPIPIGLEPHQRTVSRSHVSPTNSNAGETSLY